MDNYNDAKKFQDQCLLLFSYLGGSIPIVPGFPASNTKLQFDSTLLVTHRLSHITHSTPSFVYLNSSLPANVEKRVGLDPWCRPNMVLSRQTAHLFLSSVEWVQSLSQSVNMKIHARQEAWHVREAPQVPDLFSCLLALMTKVVALRNAWSELSFPNDTRVSS